MHTSSARVAAVLGWTLAASFFLATLILLLLNLNLTSPEPQFREGALVDNILAGFQSDQERWPLDLTANILFAVGFAAVGGLGAVLPTVLGPDHARARTIGAAFMIAAGLGLVAQLVYIGAKEVLIDPFYCDCEFRAEQLVSRREALNAVGNAAGWLTDGFAIIFSIGLLATASLAGAAGEGLRGFASVSRWVGVAGIAFVVIGRLVDPVATALSLEDLDTGLVSLGLLAVVAGILVPWWSISLSRSLQRE